MLTLLTLISFGCGFPVFSAYDRQAHLPFLIYVRVVDLCFECDLGWLKWVLGRENDLNPECTFIVWRVVLKINKQPLYLFTFLPSLCERTQSMLFTSSTGSVTVFFDSPDNSAKCLNA